MNLKLHNVTSYALNKYRLKEDKAYVILKTF